jgi:hypothetical protein
MKLAPFSVERRLFGTETGRPIMRFSKTSFIVPALSLGLIAPATAVAQNFGREQYRFEDRRYEGRSFERMRELAHVLDQRAQHAANEATRSAHHGGRFENRFLDDITHFARRAAEFHRRMDRYRESPWDVQNEIDHLTDDARRVNRQLRGAHVFDHTWDDWSAAVDVLQQMRRTVTMSRRWDRDRDRGFDHGDDHDHGGDGVYRRY